MELEWEYDCMGMELAATEKTLFVLSVGVSDGVDVEQRPAVESDWGD